MPIRSPAKKTSGLIGIEPSLLRSLIKDGQTLEKYRAAQKEKAAKGGKARAAKLSKKKLSDQGRKAVQARWKKVRDNRK